MKGSIQGVRCDLFGSFVLVNKQYDVLQKTKTITGCCVIPYFFFQNRFCHELWRKLKEYVKQLRWAKRDMFSTALASHADILLARHAIFPIKHPSLISPPIGWYFDDLITTV